jgi:hypothetical protein
MVVCTIIYNASSGSDTAASGSNAPTTAVTGTNGDISTTTFTLNETVDFTGVNDDDTDVLWIDTPAGDRHLYRITAFNPSVGAATTLTVTPSAGTARTADNWAVGGKRQTLDNDTSQPDLEDGLAGWKYELEAGTYSVAQTNTIAYSYTAADGGIFLMAASGASPTISWTGDFALITTAQYGVLHAEGITFSNTTSTSTSARCVDASNNGGRLTFIDCTADQYGNFLYSGTDTNTHISGCDITNGSSQILITLSGNGKLVLNVDNTTFRAFGGIGINASGNTGWGHVSFLSCIFRDSTAGNAAIQIDPAHNNLYIFKSCVFHDNNTDGIRINGSPSASSGYVVIRNNIFTNNGGYGINCTASWHEDADIDYNAYRSNTSGARNNLTAGANDVTLSADPYTNEAGDDYTLNATAGGGAACKDAGYGYNG